MAKKENCGEDRIEDHWLGKAEVKNGYLEKVYGVKACG